ncbi:hypothetical protein BN946_scf184590.g12 [Trametes cinnabarina]|uniref:Uncharacterized protein n=1 Tax=Pycnoporus cinnabarinus TaxID=5643 RepID=A0A060SL82_PYCCI|nr:hypothetical protein BN946_scf184590.g12 [Trametes cinnabarina]
MLSGSQCPDQADGRPVDLSKATPQPHRTLATRHPDCPCYLDPRCQIGVAFQEARKYWLRHPDDNVNAPNEVHQAIEEWLVAERVLDGPTQIDHQNTKTGLQGETGAKESTEALSLRKKAGFKVPRLRALSLKRLVVGDGDSTTMLSPPLVSRRLRRRHTEGDNSLFSGNTVVPSPATPSRNILRQVAVLFRPRRKTVSSGSADASSDASISTSQSCASSSSAGHNTEMLAGEGSEVGLRGLVTLRPIINAATTNARAPTPAKVPDEKADGPTDPAYAALMPILYELDALAEHPRCKAIAAEHNDEDYRQFWETFSQLSAKDVLCAVYAIRAGALEIPEVSDNRTMSPGVVFLCAMWGFLASTLALYLYLHAPL